MQHRIPSTRQALDASSLLLGSPSFEAFIRKVGLAEYYGLDIAKIPSAGNFVSWLKKEDAQLLSSLKSDISAGRIKLNPKSEKEQAFVLGAWLGSKYVAFAYGHPVSKPTFPMASDAGLKEQVGVVAFDSEKKEIKVNPAFLAWVRKNPSKIVELFIAGLNSTMHEGAHGLNFLFGREGVTSELGVFFAYNSLALPLKSESAGKNFTFPLAARHFPQIIDEIREGRLGIPLEEMKPEYLGFASGPWLANVLGKKPDIKSFTISAPFPLTLEVVYNNLSELVKTPEARGEFLQLFKEATSLKDVEAEAKLLYTFSLMAEMDNSTFSKFVSNLIKAMDSAFGKPKNPGIPKSYVNLERTVPVKVV
jgi:hypothetical protein